LLRERLVLRGAHIPISAGEVLNDTLLGFKTLAASAADLVV
jgi:hypothetical protein